MDQLNVSRSAVPRKIQSQPRAIWAGGPQKGVRSVLVVYSDLGALCEKTIDCLGQLMVGDVGLRGNNDIPGRYFRGLRVFFAQTVGIR